MTMRTLWLQFGGSTAVNKQFGIPELTYPLCYNIPRASWQLEADQLTLNLDTKSAAVFFDLVVEINQNIKDISERAAHRYIGGFRFCLGISDSAFLENVSVPTIRDKITCFYYSRFPQGYNIVGQLLTDSYEDVCAEQVDVTLDQEQISAKIELYQKPESVVAFLSAITTLNAGDFVSLGSFLCLQNFDLSNRQITVTSKQAQWSLAINKESY